MQIGWQMISSGKNAEHRPVGSGAPASRTQSIDPSPLIRPGPPSIPTENTPDAAAVDAVRASIASDREQL